MDNDINGNSSSSSNDCGGGGGGDSSDDENSCPICYDSLINQKNCYIHETCKKKFHTCCIDRWIAERLNVFENNVSCPLCRQKLVIFIQEKQEQQQEELETITTTESEEENSDDDIYIDEMADNVFVLNRDSLQFQRLKNLLNRNGYPFDGVIEFREQPTINLLTQSFHIRINDYSSSRRRRGGGEGDSDDDDNNDHYLFPYSRGVINVLIDRRELRNGFYLSLRNE